MRAPEGFTWQQWLKEKAMPLLLWTPFLMTKCVSLLENVTWQRGVSKEIAPVPDEVFPTLAQAVDAWNNKVTSSRSIFSSLLSLSNTQQFFFC